MRMRIHPTGEWEGKQGVSSLRVAFDINTEIWKMSGSHPGSLLRGSTRAGGVASGQMCQGCERTPNSESGYGTSLGITDSVASGKILF